jgi:ribonuclease Z
VIDLLLLGTGAMVPLPDRPLSSLLVRTGGSLVLFDCGEGTQVQMRKFHWGFRRLDAICLSHLHADHVAGLPGLFHTVANAGRIEPMHIFGPPGTNDVVAGLRVIAQYLPYEIVVRELADGDSFEVVAGMRGTVAEADHRIDCLAYRMDVERAPAFDPVRAEALGVPRLEWSRLQGGQPVEVDGLVVVPDDVLGTSRKGVSFAFVTDTRPSDAVCGLVHGVDLLVGEATYALDEEQPKADRHGHMTLRQACEMADAARVGALWLTHFSGGIEHPEDYLDAARAIFTPSEIGTPGLSARLSFVTGYERLDAGGP